MRAIVMLIFLSIAGTCYAEDPLEMLNTVEDTLSTMERTLEAQAWDPGASNAFRRVPDAAAMEETLWEEEMYFVSEEPVGAVGWIRVRPCDLETAVSLLAPNPASCAPPDQEESSGASRLWRSRAALPADLQPGVLIVAQDNASNGAWFLAKITDVSDLESGYLAITAPFRAQVKGLRVIEE
ncbi:MAG: hypothetical protein A2075_22575 [Geobacteraceae bacterium GWC2_58_44]|nr:MAG: hypothetical protein A2075_22575 [Geobacteraceae bacterium GWC2_58_44]HBG05660.1 hypothetical protein [Geobacter sp.]